MSAATGSPGGILAGLRQVYGDGARALREALLLRIAASAAMAVPVVAVAWVAVRLREGGPGPREALAAGVVVVLSVVVQFALWYASNHRAWVGTFAAVGEGRVRALDHVQALPVAALTGRGTGNVSAVLSADYEQVAVFAHNGLLTLVGGAVVPVLTIAGLAVVDPRLALVTSVSVLVAVPVMLLVDRAYAARALARADVLAAANGRIVEYVQGVATARSFGRVGEALGWYRDAVADMRRVNDELAVRVTPLAYATVATVFLGVPLVVAVTGYGLLGGTVDAAAAVVFLVLALRVYAPLVSVAVEVEGLRLTGAALERIRRLHALDPFPFPAAATRQPRTRTLAFENVTFGYEPDRPVLRDVTFTALEGSTTALVGPSGAGKSTLLALACRFHDPDGGTVTLGGVPLPELTAEQLAQQVSVVFQDVYLFTGTVEDNIAFGRPGADREAVRAAARAARCDAFVEALPGGYGALIGEGGATLSGGERQRISIARALLKDAPVVLLDEATAALDPLTEHDVHQAVAELSRGRTTLVVAHRLSTIRHADQVLVLDGGRIVQQGRHEDLIGQPGRYADMWAARARASSWRLGS